MADYISLKDVVPLHAYRTHREEYMRKMIAYKKSRRVKVGEYISLLFENRQTILFQIQELVNSEDLTDPDEIEEYIQIYSAMLPTRDELSATLFIEIDNLQLLEEKLRELMGIEHTLSLDIGGEMIPAIFEEEHTDRELTTSVHYLKFPLTESAKEYLLQHSTVVPEVCILLHHPLLQVDSLLTSDHIHALQEDFREV